MMADALLHGLEMPPVAVQVGGYGGCLGQKRHFKLLKTVGKIGSE
jgi:hypothetical protein